MILFIEDNEIICFWYETAFKKSGVNFQMARTGKEAISFYKKTEINLVLCDFFLPDMNGLKVCQKLREIERKKHQKNLTIIMISASKEKTEKIINEASLPYDVWLQKPLSGEKLKEIIKIYKSNADYSKLNRCG